MANNITRVPSPLSPWVDGNGRPTQIFINFMTALAGPPGPYANDTAAAKAGVSVGAEYYDASGVRRRRIS